VDRVKPRKLNRVDRGRGSIMEAKKHQIRTRGSGSAGDGGRSRTEEASTGIVAGSAENAERDNEEGTDRIRKLSV